MLFDYGENGNEKKNVGLFLDILYEDYLFSEVLLVDLKFKVNIVFIIVFFCRFRGCKIILILIFIK